MNITYLEGRLKTSMEMVAGAVDPCARIAHQGLVAGYKALLALRRTQPAAPDGPDLDAAPAEWVDEGGAGPRQNAV